jgi:hypothetical protein
VVRQKHRFLNAVGHEEDGLPSILPNTQQLDIQLVARHRVKRSEGFIHEQQLRVHDQRAAKGDSLLHAAGKLMGIHFLETFQAHQLEQ